MRWNDVKQCMETIVFTNGSFDVLHRGHVEYLYFAKAQGTKLIVGINSDESVKRYKGPNRPINKLADRIAVLKALEMVDEVVPFEEDEPLALIKRVRPDVLVKGADWAHYVCGREFVEDNGGQVVLAPMINGYSSSDTIRKMGLDKPKINGNI